MHNSGEQAIEFFVFSIAVVLVALCVGLII